MLPHFNEDYVKIVFKLLKCNKIDVHMDEEKNGRRFTKKCKIEAVQLSKDQAGKVTKVATDISFHINIPLLPLGRDMVQYYNTIIYKILGICQE